MNDNETATANGKKEEGVTTMAVTLEIKDLHVRVEGNSILQGVNLKVSQGETHALMGPNGSGKSTLAYAIMGHPAYEVEKGEIIMDGVNLTGLEADERAKLGLFLAFQYPTAIPGVSMANFLRTAVSAVRNKKVEGSDTLDLIPMREFRKEMTEVMDRLGMDKDFARRALNDGFSGGEKKRAEMLQMAILKPKIAVLDETDSGLDIDALKTVSESVNYMSGPDLGVLVITHYQRLLNYIKPDIVHVMLSGRIVETGGPELALQLEDKGYDWVREKHQSIPMLEGEEV